MPKKNSGLNDLKIKRAKPKEKQYKIFDGDGLHLLVTPTGGKLWRLNYLFNGKTNTIAIGKYPVLSLSDARDKGNEFRKMVSQGIDPAKERKAEKQKIVEQTINTFGNIAEEWFKQQSNIWVKGHAARVKGRMDNDLLPFIGSTPIKQLSSSDILEVLRRVESRGAFETAHRIKTIISQVFRYAIATDRADIDPAVNLKGALQPVNEKHFAAITEPDKVGELLRAIDRYQG